MKIVLEFDEKPFIKMALSKLEEKPTPKEMEQITKAVRKVLSAKSTPKLFKRIFLDCFTDDCDDNMFINISYTFADKQEARYEREQEKIEEAEAREEAKEAKKGKAEDEKALYRSLHKKYGKK